MRKMREAHFSHNHYPFLARRSRTTRNAEHQTSFQWRLYIWWSLL